MKKCSCGKKFSTVPKSAKLAIDSILPGYYFNCSCNSTLVVSLEEAKAAESKRKISFVLMLMALLGFACFFTGCAKNDGYQYCPANESLPAATGAPTVLVIGDSISIGYTPTVTAALTNYDVVHNPCNAMNTNWTKSQVEHWLDSRSSFEAITWNNGLWDIASWSRTTGGQYEANLHAIAQKIKSKTAHPLFILTTYVPAGAEGRDNADVLARNAIAVQVMQAEGIPVLDLYTVSRTLDNDHVAANDVHYTPYGSTILGQAVLAELDNLYGIH